MLDLSCNIGIYDNMIEYYFHEYFENRNIDLSGTNYKQIDNSLFEGAFSYCYKKLFVPSREDRKLNNKNTSINLRDIDELEYIYDIYESLCEDFNIIPFQKMFVKLTGISRDTIASWRREEYKHGGLSAKYSYFVKKLDKLPQEQLKNKLACDRIGMQSLANNDDEIGLHYALNEARNKELGTHEAVQLNDARKAFEAFQLEQKD